MPTNPIIGFAGLKTSGNPLSRPPGSASRADNVVSLEQGVIQPRRGHWEGANTFGDSADRAWQLTEFDGGLVIHYGPDSSGNPAGDTLAYATTPEGTWTNIGAYSAVDAAEQRLKFAQLTQSLYWNSSAGLYGLPGLGESARLAGPPRPGDMVENLSSTNLGGNPNATGSWMPVNTAVGYRVVVGRKDVNGVVKLGAPNGRLVVINPANLTVAVGAITRTGGLTVTATPTLATGVAHNFKVGDTFTLSPGEANFAAATYTVTAVTSTTVVWEDAGANVSSTVEQTISSGTKYTAVSCTLPTGIGISAGDFVQLYRTLYSATATTDPGDEEFLCYERTLTSSDISTKAITITDQTPETFLGEPLYSNANTGLGAAFEHVTPPLMHDVCVFDGRLFGAQTEGPHALTLRLLGTGSPNGLQNSDLLAIDGVVYTVANVVTNQNPTVNVRMTVSALAFVFNFTGSTFTLRQTANGFLPSGGMVFERRGITSGQFAAGTSRPSAFQDPVGTLISVSSASRTANVVTVNTGSAHGLAAGDLVCMASAGADADFPVGIKTVASIVDTDTFTYAETGATDTLSGTYYVHNCKVRSERYAKQVRFSEPEQPEAWPIANFLGGLPDGQSALRVFALRGLLYIFLERGDIYVASGSFPYTVQKFCGTATLVAPDSLVEHAEQLYALTTQGIVAISEGGVEVLSEDIEGQLRQEQISANSMLRCFGVSYEMDRQYQCWLGTGNDDGCSEAYVYHSNSGLFAKWTANRTCGLAIKNTTAGEQLVYGHGSENRLRFEKKTYTEVDFFEDRFTLGSGSNIVGAGSAGVFTDTSGSSLFAQLAVGDYVVPSVDTTKPGWVTAISGTTLTTTSTYAGVGLTSLLVGKAIYPLRLKWMAASGGAPGLEKQWREGQLHFGQRVISDATVNVTGEREDSAQDVALSVGDAFALGDEELSSVRFGVPQETQRQAMLEVELDLGVRAGQHFRLLGVSLTGEGVSERTPKGGS